MKSSVLVILLFFLTIIIVSGNDFPIVEVQHACAEITDVSHIISDQRIFFTLPATRDKSLLELWYADKSGNHSTGLIFETTDLIEINPTGSMILIISQEYGYPSAENGVFDFEGSPFTQYTLVDTNNFDIETLSLPQQMYEVDFISPIQWLDNERVLLLSTEVDNKIAILNVVTKEVEISDWAFEHIYLPWPSGYMTFSPHGRYTLYTVASPSITDINESPDRFLAWNIADFNGDIVLQYVNGIGNTARWMPDESGIVAFDTNGDFLSINLEGETTTLITPTSDYGLDRPLIYRSGNYIAFTGFGLGPDTEMQSIVVLDKENSTLTDFCEYGDNIYKGLWSQNDPVLAFKISNPGTTSIIVLDVVNSLVGFIFTYQEQNDSVASEFIRIVGWQ